MSMQVYCTTGRVFWLKDMPVYSSSRERCHRTEPSGASLCLKKDSVLPEPQTSWQRKPTTCLSQLFIMMFIIVSGLICLPSVPDLVLLMICESLPTADSSADTPAGTPEYTDSCLLSYTSALSDYTPPATSPTCHPEHSLPEHWQLTISRDSTCLQNMKHTARR